MPLGGDDKCGVALALRAACELDRPLAVLLTVQEEVGGIGCQVFARQRRDWFDDVSACLVLDRRGAGDVVVEIGGRVLDPVGAFRERVLAAGRAAGVPVREVGGLFSDALILHCETGLPVVNISVGYHQPHSPQEWVSLPHLRRAWRWVDRILDGTANRW
jgi:di/tripeptidase